MQTGGLVAGKASEGYQVIRLMVDTFRAMMEDKFADGIFDNVIRARYAGTKYLTRLEVCRDQPWIYKDREFVQDLLNSHLVDEATVRFDRELVTQACDNAETLLDSYCVVFGHDAPDAEVRICFVNSDFRVVADYFRDPGARPFANAAALRQRIDSGEVSVVTPLGGAYRFGALLVVIDQVNALPTDEAKDHDFSAPESNAPLPYGVHVDSINALFGAVDRGDIPVQEFADGGVFAEIGHRMRAIIEGIDDRPTATALRF